MILSRSLFKFFGLAVFTILLVSIFVTIAYATHSWGGYHWSRSANPLNLKLGDNVSTIWDSNLATASTDWSVSSVLDTLVVTGQTNPKNCKAVIGRVEVCNSKYGNNGWLGIAQIWASGNHITQGTVKLNDTYFNTAKYNTPAWRQFVMCQEIGHTFGLDHQDENFSNPNLATCMDYTKDPSTNQHPNQHDYDQLETIYAHLDETSSASSKTAPAGAFGGDDIDTSDPKEWGKVVKESADGRSSLHERDLGKGNKVFTFVIWAN